jgi:hypothetical protein
MLQHQSALPQIVQRQRREDEREPGPLDRTPAEMAKVRIKRFGTGDRQENGAEDDDADESSSLSMNSGGIIRD